MSSKISRRSMHAMDVILRTFLFLSPLEKKTKIKRVAKASGLIDIEIGDSFRIYKEIV